MSTIFLIHRILGSLILPLLLLFAVIWFTVAWKPETWPTRPARLFGILVGVQFALGLIFWLYLVVVGAGPRYLSFPFLLHPLAGLVAAVVAQVIMRSQTLSSRLGRWTPLVSFGSILVLVVSAVIIVNVL